MSAKWTEGPLQYRKSGADDFTIYNDMLARETARADKAEKELQESIDAQDVLHDALEAAETAREKAEAEAKALREAIQWALGENGEFAERPDGFGPYWWRIELRYRASGGKAEFALNEARATLAQPADGGK